MPDFGPCSDPSCNETSVRLFDCAHHCMKMVCLQHLIDHDRVFEQNKRQLESIQNELKRLYSIYSTLIDENKIHSEYEQKLNDYKKLVNEVNSLLENSSNPIEQYKLIIEKLKKFINEKQKQSNESLPIVKVEPIEDGLPSVMNLDKDESLFIGFDRLQNLIIDTDYHRRQTIDNNNTRNNAENRTIVATDDGDYIINTDIQLHRIAGQCPLSINGSYGLNQEHHLHRLCRKKRYNDLSNHMRQYHGLLGPIANLIARAIYSNVPNTKRLIPDDLQVIDPRRNFLCPLRSNCHYPYWLSALGLRTHLTDVHDMSRSTADMKVKKIKILNKNKPILKLKNKVCEVINQIKSKNKA